MTIGIKSCVFALCAKNSDSNSSRTLQIFIISSPLGRQWQIIEYLCQYDDYLQESHHKNVHKYCYCYCY